MPTKREPCFKEKMRRCLVRAPPGHSFCGKFLSVEQSVKEEPTCPAAGSSSRAQAWQALQWCSQENPVLHCYRTSCQLSAGGAAGMSWIDAHYPQTFHKAASFRIALAPETCCFALPPLHLLSCPFLGNSHVFSCLFGERKAINQIPTKADNASGGTNPTKDCPELWPKEKSSTAPKNLF